VAARARGKISPGTSPLSYIPDYVVSIDPATGEGVVIPIGTSFASGNWQKVIRDRLRPGALGSPVLCRLTRG
jgi:hypothetical protein